MRRILPLLWLSLGALAMISCNSSDTAIDTAANGTTGRHLTQLTSMSEKAGYAIGMDMAHSLTKIKADLDHDAVMQGLSDALSGSPTLLSEEEVTQVLQEFSQNMQAAQAKEREELGAKNLSAGEAFLAENKTKEGVITTASGLQYLVLSKGTGPSPKATDEVTVNYKGTLLDGTQFDSSYDRGTPATFKVNGVIAGWTEALQLMKVGGKYRLFVPSQLAYGQNGAGGQIGPNATLIFEVELLGIE